MKLMMINELMKLMMMIMKLMINETNDDSMIKETSFKTSYRRNKYF